jgi:hypothetical protein
MSLKKNKGEGSMQIDLPLNIEEEKDTDDDNEETEEALEHETVEQKAGKETPAEETEAYENHESANGLDKDAVKEVEQENTDTKEKKPHPFDSTFSDEVIYILRPVSYPKTENESKKLVCVCVCIIYMFFVNYFTMFLPLYGASKHIRLSL